MNKTLKAVLAVMAAGFPAAFSPAQTGLAPQLQNPISIDPLGAVAGQQHHDGGLSVRATPNGAQLRCAFQRLDGEVTAEGLWLRSTAEGNSGERFRVVATWAGRDNPGATLNAWAATDLLSWMQPALPAVGRVTVSDSVVRFTRDTLTEEYSVSMDGVRQDFVISQPPAGAGELRVELEVTGAKAESLVNGARLVLNGTGRKLAYHRLKVTDDRGRTLTARMEVVSAGRLAVLVDDSAALYPVMIDPTFSDDDWVGLSGVPGATGGVRAMAVDGSGSLFIGGQFTIVGNVHARRIAKWDGNTWSALGSGMDDAVNVLVVSGNDLYAGGSFTTAGGVPADRVAKWNGVAWSALGSGINGEVNALAILGADLYVAGGFTEAGGNPASRIARWNGTSWSPLGAGVSWTARALAILGGDVYVGGEFQNAGGNPADYIAKWNGSLWSPVGSGMDGSVNALAVSGSTLYAGGGFGTAGGNPAANVAAWNGSSWAALGGGVSGVVNTLAVSGSDLYAGGGFYDAIGGPGNYVARWNGSSWLALGTGTDGPVSSLVVSGGSVFASGAFSSAGSGAALNLARWDGNNWSALASGMDAQVTGLAVAENGDLYAGGAFTSTPGTGTNYIAKWDGTSWSALGLGLNSWVHAVAVSGTNVYVGGEFTSAGGVPARHIAVWNGNNWSAVGGGVNNWVYTLAVSGTNLYAGGEFSRATNSGGASVLVNRVARWNGTSWSALGAGVNHTVRALATSGTDVYAGGEFIWATNSGNIPVAVHRVARWNGTSWSALGLGLNNAAYALAVAGSNIYVGGTFGQASNTGGAVVASPWIAKFDGSSWSALGAGTDDVVYALAASDEAVYAGGQFYAAGGNPASRIAKWDGSAWSPLGSGIPGIPSALALSGNNLYVGGNFNEAGGKVAFNIAKAVVGTLPGRFTNVLYSPVTGLSGTFLDASVGRPYRIQASPSLSSPSWTDFTNFTYTGPVIFTDTAAGNGTNRFFRAVTP